MTAGDMRTSIHAAKAALDHLRRAELGEADRQRAELSLALDHLTIAYLQVAMILRPDPTSPVSDARVMLADQLAGRSPPEVRHTDRPRADL